jgi:hypothetical protein
VTTIDLRGCSAAVLLLLATAAGACGGVRSPEPGREGGEPGALTLTGPDGLRRFGLTAGTALRLRATVRDARGGVAAAPSPSFVSRNPAVATVDAAGVVTGMAEGDTYVVAEAASGGRRLADSVAVSVYCTAELRTRVTPRDTTLRVGEAFTPRVELSTCGGHVRLTDTLTWRARDPALLRVDPTTGRTEARAAGESWVDVEGRRYRRLEGIRVIVRPR